MNKSEKIGLSIAVVIGLAGLLFDAQISRFVASLRGFMPDFFFVGFTFEIQTFVVLFFLTSLFLFQEHKRKWIVPLWFAAFLSVIICYALKIVFARARPFELGIVSIFAVAYDMLGQHTLWNFSFPSFQAVLAFSALPILDKEFRRFKWVWFAIACLIAFSRVYFGVHFASDVILGGAIGYLIGYFSVKLEERYKCGEKANKRVNKVLKIIRRLFR